MSSEVQKKDHAAKLLLAKANFFYLTFVEYRNLSLVSRPFNADCNL